MVLLYCLFGFLVGKKFGYDVGETKGYAAGKVAGFEYAVNFVGTADIITEETPMFYCEGQDITNLHIVVVPRITGIEIREGSNNLTIYHCTFESY